MSREIEDIKKELVHFASQYGPSAIIPATVITVKTDGTIEVELSNGDLLDDVRLKSVVKAGNEFLLIPEDNSKVQIGRIDNSDEYIVISVDEIKEVRLLIGTVKLEADISGFIFEKGNASLKQIINLIIEAVQQIVVVQGNNPNYAKLNDALGKLNNLFR